MPSFPGSSFFSDTEFLTRREFVPDHYNLPLFIYSKFSRPKNYNQRNKLFLRKQLQRYKKIYNRSAKINGAKYLECIAKTKHLNQLRYERSKSNKRNEFVTPAANRYEIKGTDLADIAKKQSGTKGPYSCFTGKRDRSTYYGHMVEVVGYTPISKCFYYDLPSAMDRLNHPRRHFVMKFRKGSREKQKTYMRSMLNDLSLCPKDPKFPSPDKYYPQNFLIRERAFNPKASHKSHIFHCGPYVPESDRFYSNVSLLPGPGRYNPQIIACPCKRGTEYLEKSLIRTEYEKWKYSPLYSKATNMKPCTCEPPSVRNIPGKGFTSVFRSTTKRLVDKPKIDLKNANKKEAKNTDIPMIFDSQYIRLITQPKRQSLSYRVYANEEPEDLPEIKFNTTAKARLRQKLRTNKTVAFMSSCPRFEGDGGKATFLANKNTTEKSKSNISLKNKTVECVPTNERIERLLKLPPRYQRIELESGNEKLANLFPHLPKPKILLNSLNVM